jgi:hypothetical protein
MPYSARGNTGQFCPCRGEILPTDSGIQRAPGLELYPILGGLVGLDRIGYGWQLWGERLLNTARLSG